MKSCVEHGLDFVEGCMACKASQDQVWKGVAVELAASNARLCGIALAADELASAVEHYRACEDTGAWRALADALENYKIERNGQ